MKFINKAFLIACLTMFIAHTVSAEPIWIDVRSVEEYNSDHINGDANIPLASLNAESLAAEYGKDADIRLYCQSGNRAGKAKTLLETAGFTHVSNVGGIADARNQRDVKNITDSSYPASK